MEWNFNLGYRGIPLVDKRYATREHIAITYATKSEVNSEVGKILSRFDKLEDKLDRWMEKHNG